MTRRRYFRLRGGTAPRRRGLRRSTFAMTYDAFCILLIVLLNSSFLLLACQLLQCGVTPGLLFVFAYFRGTSGRRIRDYVTAI